jgi:hypothetical protein
MDKFNGFLERKMKDIGMEEIEKSMKKPDFIRFFKYLNE